MGWLKQNWSHPNPQGALGRMQINFQENTCYFCRMIDRLVALGCDRYITVQKYGLALGTAKAPVLRVVSKCVRG